MKGRSEVPSEIYHIKAAIVLLWLNHRLLSLCYELSCFREDSETESCCAIIAEAVAEVMVADFPLFFIFIFHVNKRIYTTKR